MFFLRKPKISPARLLQQYEYLDLIQAGTEKHAASDGVIGAAVELARSLCEPLGLGKWAEPDPAKIFTRRCPSQGALLVHVPCGMDDCFFIVVFGGGAASPQEYFLFDIGAEYMQPRLECPAFSLAEVATEENIRRCIPLLPGKDDPFAVIELRGGTYMQVYAEAEGFHLEHQLVSPGAHYAGTEAVSAEEAADTLVSYACGKYEWAYRKWERIEI
jgi:hypothetical protein